MAAILKGSPKVPASWYSCPMKFLLLSCGWDMWSTDPGWALAQIRGLGRQNGPTPWSRPVLAFYRVVAGLQRSEQKGQRPFRPRFGTARCHFLTVHASRPDTHPRLYLVMGGASKSHCPGSSREAGE